MGSITTVWRARGLLLLLHCVLALLSADSALAKVVIKELRAQLYTYDSEKRLVEIDGPRTFKNLEIPGLKDDPSTSLQNQVGIALLDEFCHSPQDYNPPLVIPEGENRFARKACCPYWRIMFHPSAGVTYADRPGVPRCAWDYLNGCKHDESLNDAVLHGTEPGEDAFKISFYKAVAIHRLFDHENGITGSVPSHPTEAFEQFRQNLLNKDIIANVNKCMLYEMIKEVEGQQSQQGQPSGDGAPAEPSPSPKPKYRYKVLMGKNDLFELPYGAHILAVDETALPSGA